MPLEYNKNNSLDYRNFQRLKYLLSVQLLVNIFGTIFLLWFGLLCITHFILSSQYFGVSKITTKSLSPVGCFGSLKLHNFNLSYFDVGGGFAKELENAGENEAKDFILETLKSTFGSDIKKYIIKYHVTSWGRNKFVLGSYSSAKPGKSHLRKNLKKSIANKIFFAGEAVSNNYGTVHGADASGIKSANDILSLK